MEKKSALILVDLQYDFCPLGALPVPKGDEVIPIANKLMDCFDCIVATKDWHPANHGSFAANHPWRKPGQLIELNGLEQILWPIHCVQNSFGAEFVDELNTNLIDKVIHKGTQPGIDSYSGFFDNGHQKGTGLHEYLESESIRQVYVMGLAADYCVKYTALDAVSLGYETFLIEDGTRGVNLKPDDTSNALEEMKEAGVNLIQSSSLVNTEICG